MNQNIGEGSEHLHLDSILIVPDWETMEGSNSLRPVLSSPGGPDATTDAGVGNLGGGCRGELSISQVLVLWH